MDAVVDDLEESPCFCGFLDLLDNVRPVCWRGHVGEVNDRDGVVGNGGGVEIGDGVRRVDEDGRDGGDAGV